VATVLVVNAGSTSLKLRLVAEDESVVELEGLDAVDRSAVAAVGHRVVHGGERFREPVVIDESVRSEILELRSIAPLHNEPALTGIERATESLPDVPHVAVFDTAFHRTMPAEAAIYALPEVWREAWGIRRYGFHGISVAWSAERAPELLGVAPDGLRLVVCHLGGGSSVTAVRDGRSVDTTMGFSPLEGVPMATRSGSVDPGVLLFLQRRHRVPLDELERMLNEESGLKGLSGRSGDVRELEAASADDEHARLALAVYTYRLAGAVAAMAAAGGGVDALVFTGGVGEHSAVVRASVCSRLRFLGVELDSEANDRASEDVDVAAKESAVRVLVVASHEELVVARAVRALLRA
jgi:acetate kinase